MKSFIFTGLPSRVVFGYGTTACLSEEVDALRIGRALILTTPEQIELGEDLQAQLGDRAAGIFSGAAMHTPVSVTNEAMEQFHNLNADGIISIGGGSTIGLGKAIALRNDTPQVVLPTTYAGSEMTPIIGQTENGHKTTQKTLKVLPETVIYDIDYTMTLPPVMSVTSGMNAIAHAVEALYAENANPLLSIMAERGISALVRALPIIAKTPDDPEARADAAYGAWLCAVCLATGGTALHHKLCHVLGGSFDLPHAETHTIVLPHALAYNASAAEEAMQYLRRATESDTPAATLYDLAKKGGAPLALRDLGMTESGIDRAVEITLTNPYWNPRTLEKQGIREVIRAAWAGDRPSC